MIPNIGEWRCDRGVLGSSGVPLPHSGLSELQLMELISHLRGVLEGAQWVDDAIPYWKLERINFENELVDKGWEILMTLHDLEMKWSEEE